MKRTILILGIVIGLAVEILVIITVYDISKKMSSGGDVFHNKADNLPVKIGPEDRLLSKGTYVVTAQGPVLVSRYWVYEYSYVTASLPILAVLGCSWLYLRRVSRTKAEAQAFR